MLGPGHTFIERGALDGLSPDEIGELYPDSSDRTLVTRMSDGTEIKVAERYIGPRLQDCIDDLEERGAELLVLLCTGDLSELESRKPLLRPDRLLRSLTGGILEEGSLGIVVPASEQMPDARERWETTGYEVHTFAISPYTLNDNDIAIITGQIELQNTDLIVLDCIGFNTSMKERFRQETGRPVLLPRTVLGGIIKEMVTDG